MHRPRTDRGKDLCPGHNSKNKSARVVILVCDTSSMQFHEYIPYGVWELWPGHNFFSAHERMDWRKELWPGHNSKTELARVVFLVCGTSPQYDSAICEDS